MPGMLPNGKTLDPTMLHTDPVLTLTLRADRKYLAAPTAAVREMARAHTFSAEEADSIALAMEEALANAMEYGYGDPDDLIRVEARCSAIGLELTVLARCLPLDQERLPKYDPARTLHTGEADGLGLLLMKEMMDRVGFSIEGDMRRTTMLKRFSAPPRQQKPEKQPLPPATDTAVHARLATPEDAEELALLAFRSHDSVFFSEHIYYPDRVREMLETGEMVSVILTTDDGEMAGHGAMIFYSPAARTAEMTYAFIDPRYRRHGGTTALVHTILDEAGRRGLTAVYALAVTNHPYSQRPLLREGFGECALLLETSPASNKWNRGKEDASQRISNLAIIKHLASPEDDPLYPPPHHRNMIEATYRHLGRAPELRPSPLSSGDVPAGPDTANLAILTDLKEGWSAIEVATFGTDAAARVAQQLTMARAQGLFAVQLLLPLKDPAMASWTTCFEEQGFFFSGVVVRDDGSDALLLQHILSERTDYSCHKVNTEFAQELVDYVRSCDPREG